MKSINIETNNLDTLNDRLKGEKNNLERVKELQIAQTEKINEVKDKILKLDFKALKLGLDLGSDYVDETLKKKEGLNLLNLITETNQMTTQAETHGNERATPNKSQSPKVNRDDASSPTSLSRRNSLVSPEMVNQITSYMVYNIEMVDKRRAYLQEDQFKERVMVQRDDVDKQVWREGKIESLKKEHKIKTTVWNATKN